MGARDRMALTKAAVLSLLGEDYRRRSTVALMGFRDGEASLLMAPTRDVGKLARRLRPLPTGGLTPLATALHAAADFARREQQRQGANHVRVVLVTDGRGNDEGLDAAARALVAQADDLAVIDSEAGRVRLGRARRLAERLGAQYARLPD